MSMHTPSPARTPRRSALTALAFVIHGVLSLALVLPALADAPTRASHAESPLQNITIRASAPRLPQSLKTGLASVTLFNDTKSEASVVFGRANPGETEAKIKALAAAANTNSLAGFERLLQAVTWLGGADDVLPGASQTAVVSLETPGLYGGSVSSSSGSGHEFYFNVTAGSGGPAAAGSGLSPRTCASR